MIISQLDQTRISFPLLAQHVSCMKTRTQRPIFERNRFSRTSRVCKSRRVALSLSSTRTATIIFVIVNGALCITILLSAAVFQQLSFCEAPAIRYIRY